MSDSVTFNFEHLLNSFSPEETSRTPYSKQEVIAGCKILLQRLPVNGEDFLNLLGEISKFYRLLYHRGDFQFNGFHETPVLCFQTLRLASFTKYANPIQYPAIDLTIPHT